MKLAVLSDFHIGTGTRAKDFSTEENKNAIDTDYKDRFLSFLLDNKIVADFLVIPGDISNSARNIEFQLASTVITEIAAILSVDDDKIIFVPGNHDSDWSVLTGYSKEEIELRRNDRYLPLLRNAFIFKRILEKGTANLIRQPYYSIWNYNEIIIVGYNSSFQDDPNIAIHHGFIQSEIFGLIQDEIDQITDLQEKIKLFIVHHHPINYSDPIIEPDHSIMVNSEELLTFLRRNHFDLIIHGHKHAPRFKILKENSGFPIAILCAGSFSALLDTRWSGIVNNQFHIIDIEKRDNDTGLLNGFVKSYTFLSHKGWVPSIPNNGIPHIMPFGTDVLPSQISQKIIPIIHTLFDKKSYIKWKDICKIHETFTYLPYEAVMHILTILQKEVTFEIHETNKDIILLKP